MINKKIRAEMLELICFGFVGVSATLVHYVVAILAIEQFTAAVWFANILAFLVALPISYLGHAFLTFSADRYGREGHITRTSALRFFLLAISGFSINEASVLLLTYYFDVQPRLGILATLVGVAVLLFLFSKFWAYRGKLANQTEGE